LRTLNRQTQSRFAISIPIRMDFRLQISLIFFASLDLTTYTTTIKHAATYINDGIQFLQGWFVCSKRRPDSGNR
jgi:hypothetical protein